MMASSSPRVLGNGIGLLSISHTAAADHRQTAARDLDFGAVLVGQCRRAIERRRHFLDLDLLGNLEAAHADQSTERVGFPLDLRIPLESLFAWRHVKSPSLSSF
jgi:hypothetical protein